MPTSKRPTCVTRAELLPALERPRFLKSDGVHSTVWELSKAMGMTQMGVGGQIDANDVVDYVDAGVCRVGGKIVPAART